MGLMLGVLGEGGVGKVLFSLEPEPRMDSNRIFVPPMYYGAAYFCVPVAAITKIMEGVCYNRKMEFSPWKCCLKYYFSSQLFIERILALFFFIHARGIERVGFLILQLCRE